MRSESSLRDCASGVRDPPIGDCKMPPSRTRRIQAENLGQVLFQVILRCRTFINTLSKPKAVRADLGLDEDESVELTNT